MFFQSFRNVAMGLGKSLSVGAVSRLVYQSPQGDKTYCSLDRIASKPGLRNGGSNLQAMPRAFDKIGGPGWRLTSSRRDCVIGHEVHVALDNAAAACFAGKNA
jgi:hypothetical protein